MPPWSTRLPSGGNSHTNPGPTSTTQARVTSSNANPHDRRSPHVPRDYLDQPPTLHLQRDVLLPSEQRPPGARQYTHHRAASGPLPKIFRRKKSNGILNIDGADVSLDEELVPVADKPVPLPSKVISGKKPKQDEDVKATKRCMCCDSRVKVPKDLQTFRCLCCLTVNDLKSVEEQTETEKGLHRKHSESALGSQSSAPRLPLSVDRARSIIRHCLATYLEARYMRREGTLSKFQRTPPNQDVITGQVVETTASNIAETKVSKSKQDVSSPSSSLKPLQDIQSSKSGDVTTHEWAERNELPAPHVDSFPPELYLPIHTGPGPPEAPARNPDSVPARPTRTPPSIPVGTSGRRPSSRSIPSESEKSKEGNIPHTHPNPKLTAGEVEQRLRYDRIKAIFRPLEDHMVSAFGEQKSLNQSFSTVDLTGAAGAYSENKIVPPRPEPIAQNQQSTVDGLSGLDAKTLLLGDIGENGSWWTGKLNRQDKSFKRKKVGEGVKRAVSSRSPNIDWIEVKTWYGLIHTAGHDWRDQLEILHSDDSSYDDSAKPEDDAKHAETDEELAEAREHAIRTLLKITEKILKRPIGPIKEPGDLRFLLILLFNPSLYPNSQRQKDTRVEFSGLSSREISSKPSDHKHTGSTEPPLGKLTVREGGQHNGLLKRIFGLIANSTEVCHRYLINWFARLEEDHFVRTVDLVANFVTHRIARRSGRARRVSGIDDGGLIPDLSGSARNTSDQLHSAMGLSGSKTMAKDANGDPEWTSDWQIKVAAKVMSLLFAANNIWQGTSHDSGVPRIDTLIVGTAISAQVKAKRSGQLVHTSGFYNTLLDYHNMIADFKVWETKREKFAFCQYPLFLSMGTKIKILEYDARRQMELKAREAYFDQVIRQRAIESNFNLRVRRDCLVDDSLRQISEAVGSGQEELKKGLRVHFQGEEGVDAGGPRKEWFLMLVRDIFDPNHGMFVYDEESHTCYFNANSFETSDQYYLVGALLGLAIYNSTILDVAFPPFAFRKLLAAAPSSISNASNVASLTGTKGQMTHTLADLAEFRPSLATGLQQLLDFEGDVEATYCRDFVAPIERYGTTVNVPLIPNGETIPVTNANRHEFVDAYVRYLLDTAVSRQFEPFKRGFFTVCAGNALSLFRAEEIELLIRGSDEALDIDSLRAVAVYENWRHPQPPHQNIAHPADSVPVIGWFWDLFAEALPERQRKLLTFITGTDRIPAVGATSLVLRIQAGGDGWGGGGEEERKRFPVARTCFNMLVLWRYDCREQLEEKLWRAVEESEGFGLK